MIQETESEHFDHIIWKKELGFYEEELNLLERQLAQLASKRIKAKMPRIEHFQNNFIRQHEVLDELKHEMNLYEDALKTNVEMEQKVISDPILSHHEFEQKMETFVKIFNEIKAEFRDFMSNL